MPSTPPSTSPCSNSETSAGISGFFPSVLKRLKAAIKPQPQYAAVFAPQRRQRFCWCSMKPSFEKAPQRQNSGEAAAALLCSKFSSFEYLRRPSESFFVLIGIRRIRRSFRSRPFCPKGRCRPEGIFHIRLRQALPPAFAQKSGSEQKHKEKTREQKS